jgi:hypothetical protein
VVKLFISDRTNLNEQMLRNEFEIVNSTKEADVVISQSTLADDFDGNFSKVIYIAVEPPLSEHRHFCYDNFDKFPLVVTHNPTKPNQIPFTETDEPQYYPTRADPSSIPQYTREDTTIKNRGVFYAGMIGPYEHVDCSPYGGVNLTKLRRELGEYLKKSFPASKIIGIGWNGQSSKVSDWRLDKSNQIKDSNCDFVLALENTMYPNYLYEKIWDGFASDRCVLYLGDPRVCEHIPISAFIDLRKYFNPTTGEFDFIGLDERLSSISQEEYDKILFHARAFRQTARGRHSELQYKLTKRIIDYIISNSERFIKGSVLE